MKFMHTSDWHIGKRIHGVSLIAEQRQILKQLVELATKEAVDFVIIAGDLFDRSVAPTEAVELVGEVLTQLANANIVTLIISGNHDSAARLGFLAPLLKRNQLLICTQFNEQLAPIKLTIKEQPVHIYAMPYSEPVAVRALLDDATIVDHNQVFRYLASVWREQLNEPAFKLLVAHGYFGAAALTSESERPLALGGTEIIDTQWLDGFDYVALGHLHRPQMVGATHIRYSGSPYKYSFSEWQDHKGVLVVERRAEQLNIVQHNLKATRDLRKITGLFEAIMASQPSDDYVHIELCDKKAIYEPLKQLRAVFPNILKLTFSDLQHDEETRRSLSDDRQSADQVFRNFYNDVQGEAASEVLTEIVDQTINALLREVDQ